ncbi:hypothetical protein RCL1_001523 [Eukaryota sp. TZLM3-RCL]
MRYLALLAFLLVIAVAFPSSCKDISENEVKCTVDIDTMVRKVYKLQTQIDVHFKFFPESGTGSVSALADGREQFNSPIEIIESRHKCFFYRGANFCVVFEHGTLTPTGACVDSALETHFVEDLGMTILGSIKIGQCTIN